LKNRRVLVTGGLGFIGWNLTKKLLDDGYCVTVVDVAIVKSSKIDEKYFQNMSLTVVRGDILDSKLCCELVSKVDGVFHLAARNSVSESLKYPDEYLKDNVIGTLNLLEACRKIGVNFFVFSSSCAVYGEQKVIPISENADLNPKSPYAVGKKISEDLCKLYNDIYLVPTVSLRYFNVFGPGQSDESEYSGVIAKFIKKIKKGEELIVYGDGNQTRDFVYVDNVVYANINASLKIEDASGSIINVGTGESISICSLIDKLSSIEEVAPKVSYEKARPAEIKSSCADVSNYFRVFDNVDVVLCGKGLEKWLGNGD
jgi:UDP-glucose 4-epimerase